MNNTGLKFGGRTKGTPNRTPHETKIILQSIVNNELEYIANLLEQVAPKDRLDAIIKLLPYIVPKQLEQVKEDAPKEFTVKVIDNVNDFKLEKYIQLYGELD